MPDLFPDTAVATFAETLGRLGTITLSEMDSVRLLNRIDTKYVTTAGRLAEVLSDAAEAGYRALRTAGGQLSGYDSVYFDTPDLKMFMDHRNRRLRRQKVRTRVYVESGDAFLEIKRKDNKGRTSKKRIPVNPSETGDFSRNQAACDYLGKHSDFSCPELLPSVETAFRRITLVNPLKTERITIDTGLYFKNLRTGSEVRLQDVVIIELKQDGRSVSTMKQILLGRRVKPLRVSKYCLAVTLTDPSARSGRYKEKVRAVEKATNKKLRQI